MTDATVSDLVARLDADRREFFEERAGIRQFDGGLSREQAECLALLDVLARHPLALTGVSLLRLARDGATRYVLVTDAERATADFTEKSYDVGSGGELAAVVSLLGGAAALRQCA